MKSHEIKCITITPAKGVRLDAIAAAYGIERPARRAVRLPFGGQLRIMAGDNHFRKLILARVKRMTARGGTGRFGVCPGEYRQ